MMIRKFSAPKTVEGLKENQRQMRYNFLTPRRQNIHAENETTNEKEAEQAKNRENDGDL